MKKILIVVLVLVIIAIAAFFILGKKTEVVDNNTPEEQGVISMCYYSSTKTARGYFDRAWVRMDIKGSDVTGEFYNLPAEKDSKRGEFEGTVGPMIPEKSARRAELWWMAEAEGMKVKEELIMEFGEGTAVAYYGGMQDRGDGTYVYINKDALTPGEQLGQIACEDLEEIKAVEVYVRENIKDIATDDEVLGGTWFVLAINVITAINQGEVVYEDGHIQSRANFTYTYNPQTKATEIVSFEVKK